MDNLGSTQDPMLHTKFQSHRSIGSGVDDFKVILPYMVAILVM